jgi:spermidine dehydrogenase
MSACVSSHGGHGGIGDYAHSNGNTWEVLSAGHATRDGAFEKRIANATDTGEIYDSVAVVTRNK